jgi:hypothetical protein
MDLKRATDIGLRKSTAALIKASPTPVSLMRKGEQVRTAAGGVRRVDDPIVLPEVPRYFGSTGVNPTVITTPNGNRISVGFVLIGLPGDDMQEDDTFVLEGETYRIIKIDPVTARYETKGWVDRNG